MFHKNCAFSWLDNYQPFFFDVSSSRPKMIIQLFLFIIQTTQTQPQEVNFVSTCNIKESLVRRQVLGRGDLRDALLPRPMSITMSEDTVKDKVVPFRVHKRLRIESNVDVEDEISFFCQSLTVGPVQENQGMDAIENVRVHVETIKDKDDESYKLDILPSTIVNIRSKTKQGAFRALTTLSQVLDFMTRSQGAHISFGAGVSTSGWTPRRFGVHIKDRAWKSWRGLMLDTARHFIPVKMILRVLRQMAMCKLNVFHWHITDAVSFPISLKTRPELASKGAFSSRQIYSSEDVRHIVDFAQKLHIRVVPEIDTPAHAASWMRAFPHIGINCSWIVPDDPSQKNNPYKRLDVLTLHPTSAETREVVDDVLRDVTEMFPDRYVHIGADEMNHRCWSEDTSTMKTLRSMSLNPKIAERKFLQKNIETLSKYSKHTIVWQEAFDSSNLRDDDIVVMTWKCWGSPMTVGDRSMSKVFASGLSVIQTQCWYLDWDSNWQTMYRQYVDPRSLGGEAAMWTERVDFTNLECRLWPRTCCSINITTRILILNSHFALEHRYFCSCRETLV